VFKNVFIDSLPMRVNENFGLSRKNFSLFKNFHIACHKESIGFQQENIRLCRKAISCLAGDNALLIKVIPKPCGNLSFTDI